MAPKRRVSEKGREKFVSEEYNRVWFVSLEAKKRFHKATEINKNILWKEESTLENIS